MLDVHQLSRFAIFEDVEPEKLALIVRKCELRKFDVDDVIFNSDDAAENIYGVLDGEVELSLVFRDRILKEDVVDYEESIVSHFEIQEKPIVVDRINEGEIFGWSALVKPYTSTAKSICTTPVQVFSVPAQDLLAMFAADPALGYAVMTRISELISRRLRNRTEKLIETWGESFGADEV